MPRVSKLLLMYEPSFLRKPVVSVFELSDPARSIKCYSEHLNSIRITTKSKKEVNKNTNELLAKKARLAKNINKKPYSRKRSTHYQLGQCHIFFVMMLPMWATFNGLISEGKEKS